MEDHGLPRFPSTASEADPLYSVVDWLASCSNAAFCPIWKVNISKIPIIDGQQYNYAYVLCAAIHLVYDIVLFIVFL